MQPIELTNANFQKEVLESPVPVLIDFWAVWCVAEDTSILMGDGSILQVRHLNSTHTVASYHQNKGRDIDFVTQSKTSTKDGHCHVVVTESNREIRVTDDHQFYTSRGWKAAADLKQGDRVAILPLFDKDDSGVKIAPRNGSVLSIKHLYPHIAKRMNKAAVLNELRKRNLIPLRWQDERILILARIVGALFSDGSLYQGEQNNYREISFTLGQSQDVDAVVRDLDALGFRTHASRRRTMNIIEGRSFTMRTFRVRCCSTALYVLLRALGVPEGNKTNTSYDVPGWIRRGTWAVQREFLAAYLGGDGPKVGIRLQERSAKEANKEPYNQISVNDIEFHKLLTQRTSGVRFAGQLEALFERFGVHGTRVFTESDSYQRQDREGVEIIHIRFQQNIATALAIARIGYRYCRQKELYALYAGAFLEEIDRRRIVWRDVYQNVMERTKRGASMRDIASELGLPYDTVYGWVRYKKQPTIKKHFLKYPQWLRAATRGLKDGLIWERIKTVSKTYLLRVQVVTTARIHNFFANGFLVHNCGPCRIQGPIVNELASEMDPSKVKIGKLNVDENMKIAQEYGILSIPTLMIFKGGRPVEQMVGVQNKAILKEKLSKYV